MEYKVPLVMTPQPEGGYTVTSPVLPELVTEGDTLSDALHNAKDALAAVIELYEEDGRSLPPELHERGCTEPGVRRTFHVAPSIRTSSTSVLSSQLLV